MNLIAIARGLSVPFFVMFDADTNCKESDVIGHKKQNATISRLLGLEAEIDWPGANYYGENVLVWSKSIQDEIGAECPEWKTVHEEVCGTVGWTIERLRKNPEIMSRTFEHYTASGRVIKCLKAAADAITKFSEAKT